MRRGKGLVLLKFLLVLAVLLFAAQAQAWLVRGGGGTAVTTPLLDVAGGQWINLAGENWVAN